MRRPGPNHNDFRLEFYRSEDKQFVSCEEYLNRYRQGDTGWTPSLEYMNLSLVVAGKEWTLNRRGVGRYPDLIPQFSALCQRLGQGITGLLRTAVEDADIGTYFLFEPKADQVLISLFYIVDENFYITYPVPDSSPQAAALYEYVRIHRDSLLAAETSPGYCFSELRFPANQLIAALEREINVGNAMLGLAPYASSENE
jgi:hypothetical protein